ncbi:MAG: DUF4124 domain-containing protein, partial [Nitrospiria bacterium]
MVSKICVIILFVWALIFLNDVPAQSTTIYTWISEDGTVTYSDDPTPAPKGAQVRVWSNYSDPEIFTDAEMSGAVETDSEENFSYNSTLGEFAVQLVRELNLGNPKSEKEAASILTNVRISPILGRWELNQPMSPELASRLRTLAVAASETGRIALTPDQALLA